MNTYSHVIPALQEDAAARMNALLGKNQPSNPLRTGLSSHEDRHLNSTCTRVLGSELESNAIIGAYIPESSKKKALDYQGFSMVAGAGFEPATFGL
jgi:hypothetical protein